MEYTQRLITLRKEAKISQAKLAELLGTTQQQINKYEHEIQELPVRRLIELANLYNVSLDWIAGRTDKREINS